MTTGGKLPHFEALYRAEEEPWSFSERGVETLRHERVAHIVGALVSPGGRVLDLGCSLGQLTARPAELPVELHAIDLSPTAVARARARLPGPSYACGSATELPFAPRSFDAIVASDGLSAPATLTLYVPDVVYVLVGFAAVESPNVPSPFRSHE